MDKDDFMCPHCGSGKGFWFDRTLYGNEPCNMMHNVCEDCGKPLECIYDPCGYKDCASCKYNEELAMQLAQA